MSTVQPAVQLNSRFVFSHPAHLIACGFGAGLAPRAPGTVGTLVALPLWWLLELAQSPAVSLGAIALLFAGGIWVCGRTARDLGVADHGAIVWDEVVAFLLVLAIIPDGWDWQLAAFALFRAFDIAKPPPIGAAERRWRGGFGVMLDDLLAAGYTLLILAALKRLVF